MAANGEVIKSFLVGLGFDVDDSSLAVFNRSIQSAALRVTALYGAVNAFAGSMVYAFAKISEGFEEMGYQYHIIAPAINKAIVLRNELLKAYSAAGINIRKVIVDSVNLNMSLAKTRFAMEAIYKSVGSRFFGLLQKQSDAFRKRLYENMPYIINALEKLVKYVFKAFEAVTILGGRLWSMLSRIYDFFVVLDKATDGWSTVILGVVAAWKLLNLEFLATPLGMVIAGMVTLLALLDDFKTWQEGGKSLFDWTAFLPVIQMLTQLVTSLRNAWLGLVDVIGNVTLAFHQLFSGDFRGAFESIGSAAKSLLDTFLALLHAIDNVGGSIEALATWAEGAGNFKIFGGGGSNTAGPPLGAQQAANTNTQNSVNANMQTSINIVGSPNADATARLTGQQQQAVNFDFVRNLKGTSR